MNIMNRYDTLRKKQKKARDLITRKNTRANNQIDRLQKRIAMIKYNRDIYCKKHNNRITDLTSLIENEVTRINKDNEKD